MTGTDLYDEKTGQVYTQVSTPVQSMVPAWVSACNGRKHLENGHLRKEQGASSLLDMSYRRCALNGFEADTIEFLGLFLAEKLYTFLRNSNMVSFRDWLMFRKTYPESKVICQRWSLNITPPTSLGPPRELPTLQKYLSNTSPATLTYLSIQNLALSAADLMTLVHIPNLAVLILEQTRSMPDDFDGGVHSHFMGTWKREISNKKAFTRLRALVFRNFAARDSASLSCFSACPKLWLCHSQANPYNLPPLVDEWQLVKKQNEIAALVFMEQTYNTIHEKMRLLYTVAAQFAGHSSAEPSDPSVSVRYGGGSNSCRASHTRWFVRVPSTSEPSPDAMKRQRDGSDSRNTGTQQPKKRNIKSGKQQDIASLLNTLF